MLQQKMETLIGSWPKEMRKENAKMRKGFASTPVSAGV